MTDDLRQPWLEETARRHMMAQPIIRDLRSIDVFVDSLFEVGRLNASGFRKAVPVLVDWFAHSEDEGLKSDLLEQLRDARARGIAGPTLMHELRSPTSAQMPYFRERVAAALAFVIDDDCIEELIDLYAKEGDDIVRGHLLLALSRIQAARVVELLLEALSLPKIAACALVGLRQHPVADLLDEEGRIAELSRHADRSIALEANRMLWRLKVLGASQRRLLYAVDDALSRFRNLYHQYPDSMYMQGHRQARILESSQRQLGVSFPPSFKEFLTEFGGGNIEGFEIFGLPYAHDVQDMFLPNVVEINLDKRVHEGLPDSILAFYADEQGHPGYYAMDLRQLDARGEALICRWDSMVSTEQVELTPIAANFGSALVKITEGVLTGSRSSC